MVVRMTMERIREERRKLDEKVKAEALAAEATVVYNLKLIRGLEKQIKALEAELRSRWIPNLGARIKHLEAVVFAEGPPVRREDCVP